MRLLSRSADRKRALSTSALASPSPLNSRSPGSPSSPSSSSSSSSSPGSSSSSSWSMELSRWRVRLRRLKRWRKYEGRASDGQLMPMSPCPSESTAMAAAPPVPHRHSMSSVDSYEFVIPPVCIPAAYRQQDRQRGVCVGGERVPFTLDGHLRRRRLIRALDRIEEQAPLDGSLVPDMRRSMAGVYTFHGRSRRACSV
ncbi:hypothetical protein P43SY_000914 [Pythium insidiosum]|uniref:Uncharacterized protein n=1 Tax=Pythium insidiosum TaxID=114742 RepID=A0AAD5LGT9_PYTIN|nr:hypothetical protein P43SY_000914 [Pythium insidiosum]